MELSGRKKISLSSLQSFESKRLDLTILKYLREVVPSMEISRSLLEKYIPAGVYINGVRGKNSYKVKLIDVIEVDLDELRKLVADRSEEFAPKIVSVKGRIDIISESKEWLIINKEAGVAVHPSKGNVDNTLANYVKCYLEKNGEFDKKVDRAGVVHRLDKPVSGLIIFAKTAQFQDYIMSEFANKRVKKEYLAKVEPLEGVKSVLKIGETVLVEGNITRDPKMRLRRVFNKYGEGKYASSEITLLKGNFARVTILTGRTHQIRATFRYLGYAIEGDVMYGSKTVFDSKRISLTCTYIAFVDQSGSLREFSLKPSWK